MSTKDITSWLNEFFEMGFSESINYVLFKNPVSAKVIDSVSSVANAVLFKNSSTPSQIVKIPPELENLSVSRLVFTGNPFVRLAGISGACAVVLGAYGSFSLHRKDNHEEKLRIFQSANTSHFMHSLALLGVPLCKHPNIAGSLFTIGILMLCGTSYYDVFVDGKQLRKFTPVGGTCLLAGWLCFLL